MRIRNQCAALDLHFDFLGRQRVEHRLRCRPPGGRSRPCWWTTCSSGRPMSPAIRLITCVAAGVKRGMRSWWSTNTVPTPVPASRLFMSLLARERSATLSCSSALTVDSSSLTDCSSSFDVSSLLVGRLQFLVDRLHLLVGRLQLLVGGLHFLSVVCRYSSLARSSRSSVGDAARSARSRRRASRPVASAPAAALPPGSPGNGGACGIARHRPAAPSGWRG